MSEPFIPQIVELADGLKCVRLEDFQRECDEAREDAAHWKTEYEIVEARLCGKKHPRDNGIISEHEIIPKLERERNEAREHLAAIKHYLTKERDDALAQIVQAECRAERFCQERDEAREALENHMAATIHTCHDECKRPMCVLRRERDEAREALMEIEDRCVDCEDACGDIQKIRDIAVKALEGAK